MKKFFYMTTLVLVVAFALTACGDDDDPKVATTATATYSMTFSQDLLDACNVFVVYKAENGRNVMEAITSTTWTKTVTSTPTSKTAAQFGIQYKFNTKSEGELTKDKYDLKCTAGVAITTNKGGSFNNTIIVFDKTGVQKNKVLSFLNDYSGKSIGYKVGEDSNVTPSNDLKYDI